MTERGSAVAVLPLPSARAIRGWKERARNITTDVIALVDELTQLFDSSGERRIYCLEHPGGDHGRGKGRDEPCPICCIAETTNPEPRSSP